MARDFIWPSSGWGRAANYLHHRLARIPGTSYAIAAGFACGVSVSFTPFIGLHLILAAFLAWLIRANIFTSAMGTIIGNPWTFPFIWTAVYYVGCLLLGWPTDDDPIKQTYIILNQHTLADILKSPFHILGPFIRSVFFPMFIGGILLGAVAWIITYWPIFKLVVKYKINRALRHKKARNRMKLDRVANDDGLKKAKIKETNVSQ